MFRLMSLTNNLLKKFFLNFLLVGFLIFIILISYLYVNFLILTSPLTYTTTGYNVRLNFLGYSLFITGVLVGFFIFFLSDIRIFFKKFLTILIFFFFFILIWFFINEQSYVNLFFLYELFLLPSFYLVYMISPNRRSIPISIYFLTWTQFGSIFIFLAVIYLYITTQSTMLTYPKNINFFVLFALLFVGFGIKIPMWPFYYWLTKTHVEASSFFSIYLSGFLVKTAVYLFNHFYSFFYNINLINFFFVIVLIGVIDSSIKMWHQMDLKKLIAYTTVQEMNILFIPLLWNNELTEIFVSLFIIIHCLLSSLFFFIIDVLTKRFGTRVTSQITGLIHIMPIFTTFIFLSWVLFCGLPFTSKFYIEIVIFNLLAHYNINIFILIIFVANVLGIIGFSKNIFNVLFGSPIYKNIVYDLTKREVFIFVFCISLLVFITYMSNLIF